MAGLLDYIFTNLDTKPLSRNEILAHLRYLEEIITPTMPVTEKVKFLGYKIKLGRKLNDLDKNKLYELVYRPAVRQRHPLLPLARNFTSSSYQAFS